MIDTNEIRKGNYFTFPDGVYGTPGFDRKVRREIGDQQELIQKLCDEVDRLRELHNEAHNKRIAAQDHALKFGKKITQLEIANIEKDKRIDALLDALVAKGE